MTDKTTHKPGCEALGGYGHGIGPCSCSEAQPEALRLADRLDCDATDADMGRKPIACTRRKAAEELRRQHAEIQQLKALNARLQPTIEDDSQNWAKCDPAIAFHLIERHSDNWADAGKMMTEFADAKAEVKLKALRDELTAQTNRAAAAEQQVTALTQRLDMANRLNTDARNQLAQLSARQAAPDGWRDLMREARDNCQASIAETGISSFRKDYRVDLSKRLDAMLSASPPPPEREPLSDQQIDELCGEANRGLYIELDQYLKAFRDAERAHGIGATNDNP